MEIYLLFVVRSVEVKFGLIKSSSRRLKESGNVILRVRVVLLMCVGELEGRRRGAALFMRGRGRDGT